MAAPAAPLRIQLLGPVRAWRHGTEVTLGPPKQRAVLALLASRAGDVVDIEGIVDALWGTDVPHTAANGVHTYVAGLRRALEPGRTTRAADALLASGSGGYCLRTDPADVDATLFTRTHNDARRSRAEGNTETALRRYEQALALWHGEACTAVPGPFAALERTRLRDLRLTAVEERADSMLAAGRHAETVTELTGAICEEPLREKLRWLLILALYRSGRQAHALRLYEDTRELLSSELGIEPGPDLRSLYQQILAGHPAPHTPAPHTHTLTLTPRPHTPPPPPATHDHPFHPTPRPAQLPPLARGFTGRTKELAHLAALLGADIPHHGATTPVAVVDGPAGAGKSAFVLELAHRLTDRFPDGQLYVDLHGTAPRGRPLAAADALGQLLTSLGVHASRIPQGLAARTTLYRSLLHGRRMLVVLDDAPGADQLRPLIPRGSSCVLATSRRRLGGLAARDGAHLLTIEPLADEDSARLLTTLSGGRLTAHDPATTRLAALCGGLPLALRIVADALVANPGIPLTALVDQYTAEHGRLDRLTVQDDATASLRSVFEASYQALPADAARMFRHLGLCRSPFTLQIAATLAETDRDTTRRLLTLLTAHHLLQEEPGHRYRFHSLIGIYAAECAQREPPARRREALNRLLRLGSAHHPPRLTAPG
ncbi:AfsR family transcriptional regulator [Streptomyces sp. CB01881]|uniref:AfsR/SARP family transcriptional regulator n=1 Tax=Streptomyces sp. CB01881 TaxID=2078691 RepID=UPI0011DF7A3E|nr:BTAD domain-containing putative transcriptional regulator [Streptomyces sp. CB01881]TYC66452.1 AfsR family transcriptional regulator [Streptomyces sp. CB01881]